MQIASPYRKRRTAFTLIELLVVIAIIAILAAILFPVFAQARAKARQASCTSNLKQLTLAAMMYVQDYDGNFPYWNWWYQSDAGGCGSRGNPALDAGCGRYETLWINAVYTYSKNSQIYACPSDAQQLTPANSNIWWWTNQDLSKAGVGEKLGINPAVLKQQVSYGMSEPLHFGELFGNGTSPTTDSQLEKPAQVMAFADSVHFTTGSPYPADGVSWGTYPDPNNPNDPNHNCLIRRVAYSQNNDGTWANDCTLAKPEWESGTRHSGGQVIGYADGHVKWLKNTQTTNDLFRGTFVR
ncbi:MAG TPA: DUF1559 domain-containing protein [Chthonomonadaceae bacterium]|nr:DUF1559 domain-containing protein [Chthonomonadaceae bacterium]